MKDGAREAEVERINRALDATRHAAADLVGLAEDEARRLAESRGLAVRVVTPDAPFVTADLRTDRVTLRVVNGSVVDVFAG